MCIFDKILIVIPYLILASNVNCSHEKSFKGQWKVSQIVNQRKVDQILSQYIKNPTHVDEFKKKLLSNFVKFKFANHNEIMKNNSSKLFQHKGGVWEYSPSWTSFFISDDNKPIGILKFENYYKLLQNGKIIHFAIFYKINIYKGKFNFSSNSAIPDGLGGEIWLSMHPIWPNSQYKIGSFNLEPDIGPLIYDQTTGPMSDHLKRKYINNEI